MAQIAQGETHPRYGSVKSLGLFLHTQRRSRHERKFDGKLVPCPQISGHVQRFSAAAASMQLLRCIAAVAEQPLQCVPAAAASLQLLQFVTAGATQLLQCVSAAAALSKLLQCIGTVAMHWYGCNAHIRKLADI